MSSAHRRARVGRTAAARAGPLPQTVCVTGSAARPEPGPVPSLLRRDLGFWEVAGSGVGVIVGAGIYVLVGAAAQHAGAATWLSFLVAAALSFLTALSYGELASMYPHAGGVYAYTRAAFHPVPAFLTGWTLMVALAMGAASVALGFAHYLREFVGVSQQAGALTLIGLCAAVALTGIKYSARFTIILSLVEVGGLLLVIGVGAPHIGDVNLLESSSTSGILRGAALVFFAFIGFDEVVTLAEETRNPHRTIPLAVLTALAVSTVLYVLVAIAAVSAVGAGDLASAERPLALVLEETFGGGSVTVISVIALLATTNTALMMLTAGSRVAYGMASAGALPQALATVGAGSGVPWPAVAGCAAVAALLVLPGDIAVMAGATDAAIYFVFLAVNLSVIALRFRRPTASRAFRTPVSVWRVPLLPIFGIGATALMLSYVEAQSLLIGAGLSATGGVAYLALRPRGRRTSP